MSRPSIIKYITEPQTFHEVFQRLRDEDTIEIMWRAPEEAPEDYRMISGSWYNDNILEFYVKNKNESVSNVKYFPETGVVVVEMAGKVRGRKWK